VLFLAAEVVLRAAYHPENLGTVIRFDPLLGWALEANATMRSVDFQRDIDYMIRINSAGFRDDDVPVPGRRNGRRILIIGDSVAFGTGVDARWRFSNFLDRALDGGVINAGVPGWGNDQELLYFESAGSELEPDIVILTITLANDVVNNMLDHLFLQGAPKPRFVLDGDSLKLSNTNFEAPTAYRPSILRQALKKSRLLVFVKRRLDAMRARSAEQQSVIEVSQGFFKENLDRNCSNWSVYKTDYVPEFEDAFRVTEAIINRFARVCDAIGARLIVFPFPLRVEVDDEWREAALHRATIDPDLLDMRKPYERLSAFCHRNDIVYFHPLTEFREAVHKRYLYLEKDNHPNAYGHALAARLLLDELNRRYGLEFHIAASDVPYFAAVH